MSSRSNSSSNNPSKDTPGTAGNSHDQTIDLIESDDDDIVIFKEVKKPLVSKPTRRTVTQTTQTEGSTLNDVTFQTGLPRAGPAENPRKRVAGPSSKSPEKKFQKPEFKCPVCLEDFDDIIANKTKVMSTKCGHIFCEPCLQASLQANSKLCPTCRTKLTAKTHYHQIFLS